MINRATSEGTAHARGDAIRAFREQHSWSQEQLRKEAAKQSKQAKQSLAVNTIQRAERSEKLKITTLRMIADALNCAVADISEEGWGPEARRRSGSFWSPA